MSLHLVKRHGNHHLPKGTRLIEVWRSSASGELWGNPSCSDSLIIQHNHAEKRFGFMSSSSSSSSSFSTRLCRTFEVNTQHRCFIVRRKIHNATTYKNFVSFVSKYRTTTHETPNWWGEELAPLPPVTYKAAGVAQTRDHVDESRISNS